MSLVLPWALLVLMIPIYFSAKLKGEISRRENAEERIVGLEAEIKSLKSNIEGIQIAAKLSEEARQEDIAALKVKHVEEVTSMEHIWRGIV